MHSTPGVPQGRGKIERLFGTINTELLPTLPGHIPHGTHGRPVTAPALTLPDLDAALAHYLVHTYHQRPHSETGQPPTLRWSEGGWLPRLPDSLDQLDMLLLTVARPRVVHRDGIHVHGLRYLALALADYVGEPVTVRYDPRDLAEVRVFHADTYLCTAVTPELARDTISLRDLQAARTRRRRDVRAQLATRLTLAEQLLPTSQVRTTPTPAGGQVPAPTSAAPVRRLKL